MEEIKKKRPDKDATSARKKYVVDEIARNKQVLEGFQAIANASWTKYLAGALVIVAVSLLSNFPFVRHIHFSARMADVKEDYMNKFLEQMDKEESIFQQNLLKRFRSVKRIEIKNVTDDELRSSKFFD